MHHAPDETSRPPRRRALGRGPEGPAPTQAAGAGRDGHGASDAAATPPEPAGPTAEPATAPGPEEAAPSTEPEPSAVPSTGPEPGPVPPAVPVPGPVPSTGHSAEPVPLAVPEPEPELVPEVEPATEPVRAPGPVPAPGAETPPEPEVEPETVPVPEAEVATEPAPEVEPATAPVAAPSPEPVPEPEAAPVPSAEDEPAPPSAGEPPAGAGGGDGRFTVRLANFEGPFDLLLQLITKHKLDVTEVALSQVTDEFMAHLRALGPDGDLDQTTEFLVVAATLLDLKAARLLPAAEVEDEADLALLEARDLLFARLLQYRAYKRIAAIFEERWEAEGRRHPRTVGLEPHHAELLPEVVISIGAEGFARLAVKAMQPKAEPQVYVDHIHAPLVSVREQAAVVVSLLRERGTALFRELIEDVGDDTLTVVARFLALLELYREKAVALDQETALGDLTVSWTGGEADPAAAVTDEFDQETTA
ncbi:chromosome segregation protein ScpA [Streptomyces sp. CB02009]|uniref:segregation and condensation protein A n=1 Tax=Streptomyces sp. CB02009 TaxID=1703938 RepID=UPI00093E4D2E|nr:ScpA family protein [Streptomyces sp. CB02009]OKJ46798.1 chromosome segregation protein ScpA [Streptomyces sp. CB02009]